MDNTKNFPPGTFETSATSQENSDLDVASSSSVSSLINHNQDLASRLNVAVGRNIELEKPLPVLRKLMLNTKSAFNLQKIKSLSTKKKKSFYRTSLTF